MSRSAESLDKEEKVFESFPSTWELVLDHCPENEVEEVKRILGTSLIEQAADLHDEVSISVLTTYLGWSSTNFAVEGTDD